ncbi:hypothetical protein [Aurantimonas sp. HBX-1]|uniref:hypothetical protein n=1 Tax=Aurantimonas sp. HBX-1 TaxID=2906072 RepID=UPI001F35C36A|nr:hypothetical protein [Aurantimonas sp. HBX-1]UIJ72792.1 hypothetical protein LXB15_03810 [Aurantimonas sp. HBX-1]
MKGTKAFPEGFGDDTALMFAGSSGSGDGRAEAPPSPADGDPTTPVLDPPAESSPPAETVADGYEPAWPAPSVKLGRRGFHFPPPSEPGDETLDDMPRQPPSVLLPAVIVGLILAVASYFFNFVG